MRRSNAAEEKEIVDMAFTRKMLKAFGIEDNIIDQIMDAHVEVVEGIKTERDTFRAKPEGIGRP